MSNKPSHGNNQGEYILSTLTDDTSDEEDDASGSSMGTLVNYEDMALRNISSIKQDVERIEKEIRSTAFGDSSTYHAYGECILQAILKLDNIETSNNDKIREARRNAVLYAQECLKILDSIAKKTTEEVEKVQ